MAATNKSIEIRNKKDELTREIAIVNLQIKEGCKKIPKNIVNAPRDVSIAWRDCAEKHYHKQFGDSRSLSLSKLEDRVNERRNLHSAICGNVDALKQINAEA